ncbi:hypothetical protein [Pedobacter sp. UC225_65]|uniref:hypothetical protein n=1 Tax=Pedobacter sp. UC225_65 TaxID=3350173 RepID=UPI00367212C4
MKQFIFLKKLFGLFGIKAKDGLAADETFTEERGIDFVITTYGLHSAQYKQLVQTLRLIQSFGGDEMGFEVLNVD